MRNNQKFIPIIGLEIHVELKTESKMFCGCRNDPFHAPKPNIYTCPVCLGLPGALPVPSKKAIEQTVMLGLGLSCRVNKESRFDRKHYFYPDLPKGYQISQYEKPFCVEGELVIARSEGSLASPETGSAIPTRLPRPTSPRLRGARNDGIIRIRRVHLEEDTGKLLHRRINGQEVSLVDFNRSGVALAEIVTEPDIRSAEEAKLVAQKIQRIVRFLGISDANMEEGSMRLEANISLLGDDPRRHFFGTLGQEPSLTSSSPLSQNTSSVLFGSSSMTSKMASSDHLIPLNLLPNYKVELKNINSFRFLERAIKLEVERQKQVLSSNKVVKQQTFGWDTEKMELKPQRVKEEAADYRYFPEPDIPPISLSDRRISEIRNQISYLPDEVFEKLINAGVAGQAAEVISSKKAFSDKIIEIIGIAKARSFDSPDQRSGSLGMTDIPSFGNWVIHHQGLAEKISEEELVKMFRKEKTEVVGDEKQLAKWVEEAVGENPKAAEDYRRGKEAALQYLIGQVQRRAGGKADVGKVKEILINKLT